MSKNELALVQNNPVAINKLFGFEGRPKPLISILRVNGSDEEEGLSAPKGTFVYDDGEKILYANEVSIRSFLKCYQYRLYHATDKEKNDASIIGKNFKQEYRSISGRVACGKMHKKTYAQLGDAVSVDQKFLQENVKCKLLVFGLVSGKFTDLDTKTEVDILDELFIWTVSQSGFVSIDQTITGIEKERRAVPLTPIRLRLKKEKNGAVTYFVPIPEVLNQTVKLELDRDASYIKKIESFIKDNNDYVNERYNEAIKGRVENDNFSEVAKKVKAVDTEQPNDPLDDL